MQVLALLALEGTVALRESWDSDIAADFAYLVDLFQNAQQRGRRPYF